jgi:hypothetical protein
MEKRTRWSMPDYRIETKVESDGSLTISGLPFQAGDRVEVIVRSQKAAEGNGERYPLRGKPFRYANPFDSVGEQDWGVLP